MGSGAQLAQALRQRWLAGAQWAVRLEAPLHHRAIADMEDAVVRSGGIVSAYLGECTLKVTGPAHLGVALSRMPGVIAMVRPAAGPTHCEPDVCRSSQFRAPEWRVYVKALYAHAKYRNVNYIHRSNIKGVGSATCQCLCLILI